MSATKVAGLDPIRLRQYVDRRIPGLFARTPSAQIIPGGRSNLTYILSDGRHNWVVRRPPLGHVLATAHDMAREYTVMAALAPTAVPVPPVLLLCEDVDVIGAPFYLMDFVPGTVYRRAAQSAELGAERADQLARNLVDVLVQLHTVDPAAVGLTSFGRPDGFLNRQINRWSKQATASHNRDLPDLTALQTGLAGSVPSSGRHAIVHGDYRLDNVIASHQAEVLAVLDWEMSTLGDPLADLGLMRVYWDGLGELAADFVADAVHPAAGFPAGATMVERYATGSGRDVSSLPWYEAFAYYKLAVIVEGIHYRHLRGQTVGAGFDAIGGVVPALAAAGRRRLRNL